MGNQSSQTSSKQISHPKFKLIPTDIRNNIVYMVPTFSVSNENTQNEWQQKLINTKKYFKSKQAIILPVQYRFESVPCGLSKSLKIWFPYFPYDLEFEITNRIKLNLSFNQSEIYYLLYNLLEVSSEFQQLHQKSGNIKPSNILINEQGDLKLITTRSYPGFLDSYKAVLFENEKSFLAPEQIQIIQKRGQSPNYSLPKSQSFAIGMTILSTALLCNLLSIYSENNTFDEISFAKSIKAWKQHQDYSSFLKQVVLMMINYNPEDRISPAQMKAYLSPYKNSIKQALDFQPNEITSMQSLNNYLKKSTLKSNDKKQNIHILGSQLRQKQTLGNDKTVQKIIPVQYRLANQSAITTKINNEKSKVNSQILPPTPSPLISVRKSFPINYDQIRNKLSTIGQQQQTPTNINSIINEFKMSLLNNERRSSHMNQQMTEQTK